MVFICCSDWIVQLHELQSRSTRNQEPSSRDALHSGLTSADSGHQLDLEIALSGVSAKIQRPRAFLALPKMR